MKVTCDKCGAHYNIPDEKLTRDVNKATCKKCKHKIVVRKEARGEERLESQLSAVGDFDGIPQDERTIITVPTELQGLESPSPLGGGGLLNPLDLEKRGGDNKAPEAAGDARGASGALSSSFGGGTAPTRDLLASGSHAPVGRPESSQQSGTYSPVRGPEVSGTGPGVGAVVGGQMAAASGGRGSSPLSGQGQANQSPGTGASGNAPGGPAIAGAGGNRANVAAIFVQKQEEREAEAAQVSGPPSPLPYVFMGIALAGLLLFLPKNVWTVQPRTVLGFLMALYGLLAALLVHMDFLKTGKVNYAKSLAIPLIPVVLMAGYWKMLGSQGAEDAATTDPAAQAAPAVPGDAAAGATDASAPAPDAGAPAVAVPAAGGSNP